MQKVACCLGVSAKSHVLSSRQYKSHVPSGISTKSHVLSGISAKSHVLSGTSAKSHVLSGISAKGHVLSGISAKSHVLSGISHVLITKKYSCGRRGGFELETDGFRMVFNDFLPAGEIKKSKGPPDSSRPASISTKSHVLSGISIRTDWHKYKKSRSVWHRCEKSRTVWHKCKRSRNV